MKTIAYSSPVFSSSASLKKSVLQTLAYYDIFSFPLTKEEVYQFAGLRSTPAQIYHCLEELAANRVVFKIGIYYLLRSDVHLVQRREKGATKALELISVAKKVSGFLTKFPYVKGIAISGSLSKKYADEWSDIDLFIITAGNRLWIARTLMHAFKKLTFLINKQDYFCMNYFIDENTLEIPEQNLFTATETVTLMPLQGDIAFEKFFATNTWTRQYLPNNLMRIAAAKPLKSYGLKTAIETLFKGAIGKRVNCWLMKITAARWAHKTLTGKTNAKGIVMSMVANIGFAKPNPVHFQQKVMDRYKHRADTVLQNLHEEEIA